MAGKIQRLVRGISCIQEELRGQLKLQEEEREQVEEQEEEQEEQEAWSLLAALRGAIVAQEIPAEQETSTGEC